MILFAGLLIVTIILVTRLLGRIKGDGHIRISEAPANNVDITVYAYEPEIGGLDDIKAKHIGIYRDTGVITGMEDDCTIFRDRFEQTKEHEGELSLIVRSAAEVKRVTDRTVIYFFNRIKPLNIRSGNIRVLYDCISRGLDGNKPVVLRMTKSVPGDID